MHKAILNIYRNKTIDGVNKSTILALSQRGILDNNDQLTDFGGRYAISQLPLAKQCEEISLELNTMKLQYTGRPETALLAHYKSLGYIGVSCEGIGILTVLKALMLDKLAKYNSFNDRDDACTRYLEAQFTILKEKIDEIISEIKLVLKNRFVSNFQEIISKPFIALEYPELSIEFASALFDAVDKELFIKVANKLSEDPYTFRNGWPDLTLIKDGGVSLVEVKTTDKLHDSQLITIPIMRDMLPFKFSVCRITK